VTALAELDKERFFGPRKKRSKVTLLFAVSDSDREHEEIAWAEQLNPGQSLDAYKKVIEPKRVDTDEPKPRDPALDKKPPCPECGEPLRTGLAKQCLNCGADWH
jgi:hypothetical protein